MDGKGSWSKRLLPRQGSSRLSERSRRADSAKKRSKEQKAIPFHANQMGRWLGPRTRLGESTVCKLTSIPAYRVSLCRGPQPRGLRLYSNVTFTTKLLFLLNRVHYLDKDLFWNSNITSFYPYYRRRYKPSTFMSLLSPSPASPSLPSNILFTSEEVLRGFYQVMLSDSSCLQVPIYAYWCLLGYKLIASVKRLSLLL